MTASRKLFAIFIFILSSQMCAPAQTPTSACGGQPLCVETSDFTAMVTSFRTSLVGSSRIINVSVRFQNRTAQPLVLGYVANSGITTDERGNRYIVYGGNGFRGIGLVYGNTFDSRLTLRPAGSGDAQFEMHLQATPQNAGQSFTVDVTIDEINTTGNQPALGGEFPLHFEGLANGVSQGVGSLAGAPDGLANAVSNLKSLFGKKKAVQNAASVANSAANTAAAVNAAGNSASAQPPSATPNTPGQAGSSAKAAPQQLASAQPAAGTPNGQTAGAAEPWTPPADNAAEAAALVDPLKLPEVAKMPDVVGVRLGMSEQEAAQILRGQYPRGQFQPIPAGGIFPTNPKADYGFNILPTGEIATDVVVSLTAPPGRQVVWQVERNTRRMHANHANVLATLRAKYGKETLAGLGNGTVTTDDRSIGKLFWAFDEHGNHVQLPSPQTFGETSYRVIPCSNSNIYGGGPRIPMEENKSQDWCASVVAIVISFEATEIVETTVTNIVDMRLATRTANAYLAWKRDADAKARAAAVEQSKKNKPVF
ncbi:MAG: hypothetical protein WBB89_17545 [Candidatus Acidiferrum sp.]